MEETEMKTDGSDQTTKGREFTPQQREVATLRGELQKMTAKFDKALAGKITPDRMVRIVLTAVQTTPKLAECSRVSFFSAVMHSCQLALEPNTPLGQSYLIPRWNGTKKCFECKFQIGYQGMLDLAYRSDQYKRITAEVVYEGDNFDYEYGLDCYLRHKPFGKSDRPQYVYALYELKNGGREFKVWTWEKIMQHAEQFSESFDKSFSPWKSNKESQEGMAKKTVLINLLKYAPKSAEIASAINADDRVLRARRVNDGEHSFMSIDVEDIPVTPVDPESKEATPPPVQTPVGNGAATTPTQTQTPTESPAAQVATSATPRSGTGNQGNGHGKDGNGMDQLFGSDEEAALQELYERQTAGVNGPDFG
jgi:recombination protein RecT